MADRDILLSTVSSATQLGNDISLKMVEFLNTVKDQPAGFRDLGLDFLSICSILNSLEDSLKEHFKTNQPFPHEAIPELIKVLKKTLDDFTQLKALLQKFMDYERGGAVAMLQKTWRMVFADKDIAKVRTSLQANSGALTMTILLLKIIPAPQDAPIGYEYGMLAAKLDQAAVPGHPPVVFIPAVPELEGSTHLRHEAPGVAQLDDTSVSSISHAAPTPRTETWTSESAADQILTPSISEMSFSDTTGGGAPSIISSIEPNDSVSRHDADEGMIPVRNEVAEHEKTATRKVTIRVDRSKLLKRVPKSSSSANSASLQRTLLSAVSGKKHKIAEQLLDRGVSPDTGPETCAVIEAAYYDDLATLKLLLEFGADPDAKKSDGNTALHCACQRGLEPITKLLLEYGADPNISAPHWTPLPWALDDNKEKIVCLLLQYGADSDFIMNNGDTSLVYACNRNTLPSIVQEMLEYGANPNAKDKNGNTPLQVACQGNRPEIVKILLAHGADPNLLGRELPIDSVIRFPGCLELLIRASVNLKASKGLMELATYHNQIDVVRMLLDAGLDPNEKRMDTYTPLGTAIRDKHPEIIPLLLSRGADPYLKGQDFPLAMAVRYPEILKQLVMQGVDPTRYKGLMELAVYHNSIEAVEFLLDAGVNPNDKHHDTYTPITTAIRDNHPETLALLLSRGADPNLKGQEVPLAMAVRRPHILRQLVEGGAEISKYKGLVELAVYHNSVESVNFLLDAGVDPNEKHHDTYSPLTTAIRDNHSELVDLLLSRGADPNFKGQELPLVMALRRPTMLKKLLAAGADVTKYKGLVELSVYHNQPESIKTLLDVGVPIEEKHHNLYSPLSTAIRDNHKEILALLITRSANPNAPGESLPLIMAVRKPEPDMLRMLLDAKADPNIKHNGHTALMQACEENKMDNVKLLLEKGADPDVADNNGTTALDIAANRGHDDLVAMLLDGMG